MRQLPAEERGHPWMARAREPLCGGLHQPPQPRHLGPHHLVLVERRGGLLHHSTTINIRGESYRLKDKRKAGVLALPRKEPDMT
jgi:hypothetical protein